MVTRLAGHHAGAGLGEFAAIPQANHATVVVKLGVKDTGARVLDDVEFEASGGLAEESGSRDEGLGELHFRG